MKYETELFMPTINMMVFLLLPLSLSFFLFFFFEPLEFGIQINRCSGMRAEKCLSLSSCLLSHEDLQGVSVKELTLVMMVGVFFQLRN